MKIVIVVNPSSGRRFNRYAIESLKNRLSINHQITEFSASSDEELDSVGKSLLSGFDLVIICGGDGTVSRICHYLINSDVPFLICPMGSGNDFANHLHMSNNLDEIIYNVNKFETRKINSITINDACTTLDQLNTVPVISAVGK